MAWRKRIVFGTALVALAAGANGEVEARSISKHFARPIHHAQPEFQLLDPAVGGTQAPATGARTTSLQGSTVVAHDGDVLVLDVDSGRLIRTDADGSKLASMEIGAGASQLVVDHARDLAFVADRSGDRIVAVKIDTGLEQVDAWRTDREPYGLALTPDGSTLLVTSVAQGRLTAYSTESGLPRWSTKVGDEPRGVAVSPDGTQALVTFLTMGAVARVSFAADDARVSYQTLDPALTLPPRVQFGVARQPSEDQGRSFARNAFAATFLGNGVAVVPHQLSTPHLPDDGAPVQSGGYGGGSGFQPPITHRLAFFEGESGQDRKAAFAVTNLHQPRATAYDPGSDTLFVAGYGSDDVLALTAASQMSVRRGWRAALPPGCGPNGLTVDPGSGDVIAYCSLTRTTARITVEDRRSPKVASSNELAASRRSKAAQRGAEVFRRGNSSKLSTGGAMSCSNCHAEARTDGLSWFLQGNTLQTPLLAGRLDGAHPFKWDGKDPNLNASLTNTVKRLGGSGLTKAEVADLTAFLHSVDPPRTPEAEDAEAVARGKDLFESDVTACSKCHYGSLLTDNKQHKMAADLPQVDTPSLLGLAYSAPYYHDGSAQTLTAMLEGKGKIHGMGRTSRLSDAQIDDLVAYLETL